MLSGVYAYLPQDRVVFGQPVAEAVAAECERLGAGRAFIVAARSLSAARFCAMPAPCVAPPLGRLLLS